MAQLTVGTVSGFSMGARLFGRLSYEAGWTERPSTVNWVWQDPNESVIFDAASPPLTVVDGSITQGGLGAFAYRLDGAVVVQVTGFNLNIHRLYDDLTNRDDTDIWSTMLLGDDLVVGGAGADFLVSYIGDDTVFGGAGNDTLYGSIGNDLIYSNAAGADVIASETSLLRGHEGDDTLYGGAGFDDIHGNQGEDSCAGGLGDDWVVGGQGNDILFGDEGGDIVYGNLGNDTCEGGEGSDWVRGGQADDVVRGGGGNDLVSGDRGNDTVSGGAGADRFLSFAEADLDRIIDFNRGEGDVLVLSPGVTYTVSQVGADVIIDMVGGGRVVLADLTLAQLTGDWLVFGFS
jgi:Ca2+-binding RTX toxin-like protein